MTLKLRLADFSGLTRAKSLPRAVADRAEFAAVGQELLDALLPLPQPVRLMGLGLSSLEGEEDEGEREPGGAGDQLALF